MTARFIRRALVVFGGALVVSGCVLAVDFDALEGSGATSDGAVEATLSDVTTDQDAASEASEDAALEGGTSPCTATHAFCSDFDRTPYNSGFSKVNMSGMGTIGADSLALSAPNSLHSTTVRKLSSDNVNWTFDVEKDFNLSWRHTVFQGDVYMVQPDWQNGDINISLVAVYMFSDSNDTGTVFFRGQTSATGSIENPINSTTRYETVPTFPYSTWTHIVIDFDPAGHLHYAVGGQTYDTDFTAITGGSSQSIQLAVGAISYNQPIPAMDIRWDNVFVDFP